MPVAVGDEQGGGQIGWGSVPVLAELVTQGGTHRTEGHEAPGGQTGAGGQAVCPQEAPSVHGGEHGDNFTCA
jgi:hypothetical protein